MIDYALNLLLSSSFLSSNSSTFNEWLPNFPAFLTNFATHRLLITSFFQTDLLRAVDQPSALNLLLRAAIDIERSNAASEVRVVDRPDLWGDEVLAPGFMEEL